MPPQRRCASQTGLLFSLGRSSSPPSLTLACSHTATRIALSAVLMVYCDYMRCINIIY